MISAKELQERFDKLFEIETADTFNAWLKEEEKRERDAEILKIFGQGYFEPVKLNILKITWDIIPEGYLQPEHTEKEFKDVYSQSLALAA